MRRRGRSLCGVLTDRGGASEARSRSAQALGYPAGVNPCRRVDGIEIRRRIGLRRMRPSTPLVLLGAWGEPEGRGRSLSGYVLHTPCRQVVWTSDHPAR